jgi:hypothetical protein
LHAVELRLGDDAAEAAAALEAYERNAAVRREDAAFWAAHPRSASLARPAAARGAAARRRRRRRHE